MRAEHEIHKRRFGRNVGVAMVLVGFIAVAMTVAVKRFSKRLD